MITINNNFVYRKKPQYQYCSSCWPCNYHYPHLPIYTWVDSDRCGLMSCHMTTDVSAGLGIEPSSLGSRAKWMNHCITSVQRHQSLPTTSNENAPIQYDQPYTLIQSIHLIWTVIARGIAVGNMGSMPKCLIKMYFLKKSNVFSVCWI